MLQHTLIGWKDRHFWLLLFLSLVALFCIYWIILPSPVFINLGTEGDERYLRNFHLAEQGEQYPFRWTKDLSYIKIPNLGSLPLEITLGADAARPEGQPLPRVSLIGNGTVLAHFTMQNGIWAHQFLYHPPLFSLPSDLLLEIKSETFSPPGDEYRALGIFLNTVEVRPTTSPLRLFQTSLMASLIGALSLAFGYLLLRWLGVSQKKSLVCGTVVLALLGFGIVRQFIVAGVLVGFWGLLLVGYVLAALLEAGGYREPLVTGWVRAWMTLKTWTRNLASTIRDPSQLFAKLNSLWLRWRVDLLISVGLLLPSLVALFCIYWIILPSPIFINLGTEDDERYLRNFHLAEQGEQYPFRWTKDSSYIKIPNLGSLPLEITLGADAARPEGQPLPRVSLIANGTTLAHFTMQNGIWAHQFLYHPPLFSLPSDLLLEIKSDTFSPPGDEYRALGILLNTVEVKPITSPLRLFQVSLIASLMGVLPIAFSYLLLRWLGVSQKKSLACGTVVLALLGFGIVRQFIVARALVGFWGLLLVGYVLAALLEAGGYREPLVTGRVRAWMTLKTWTRNLASTIRDPSQLFAKLNSLWLRWRVDLLISMGLLFPSLVVLFYIYWIILPSPIFINLGTEGDERYLRNFHFREQGEQYPFRWTRDSSYIKIPNLGSLPLEITLGADAARPEGQPLPRVVLIANGTTLAHFTMKNGIWAHQFLYYPPPFPLPKDLLLKMKSDTFIPPGDEYRALGILLNTVEVKPITSPLRLFQVSLIVSLMGVLSIAFSYLLLRWRGVSQRKSFVCGLVVLALLGLGIVRQFIVARLLIGVLGLLVVGYVLTMLHPFYKHSRYLQSGEISDVLPAYLPAVVLFVLMPFALFLPNQEAFNNNLTLVIPYLILAVVYFVFLTTLLLFASQPLRTGIVILLFYIGLYLCLSDTMSPIHLGELMGGRETPKEPLFLSVVEVVLAIIIILGMIKLPWKWVKRFGSIFVLLLLVSEVIVVFKGLSPATSLYHRRIENISNPPEKPAAGGNIYHITLDSYSSASLLDSLETMKLTEEFDGFTFFEKNRTNYDYTFVSVPSYMTGSFYEENNSLKEWKEQHKSSGIIKNVYDAGYEVSMYVRNSAWTHEKASHVKTLWDMLSQYDSLSSHYHFADLWLLHVVPNFLQQEVYWEGKGVFTRSLVKEDILAGNNAYPFGSVELMRQLINDEADRPDYGQYVYAHLYIPHPPYIMNRDCVFLPGDSNYDEQTLCATRLVAELVSTLRELGRYQEATIIIQSDHAMTENSCPENVSDRTMSLEIEKEIEAINLRKYSAKAIDNLTCALLMVKPPLQSGKPLVISDRQTQLADIPTTIYDLVHLPVHPKEGESVFSLDFPKDREIHIFVGLHVQRDEKGEEREFGKDLVEGEANHFSLTNGEGWKIYPNIHVRWE